MPVFSYVARDRNGRTQSGTREAATESALLETLRGGGLVTLDLRLRAAPARAAGADPSLRFLPFRAPRSIDVELGFQQLATMLRSGLPLLRALRICAEQAERKSMARVFEAAARRVEAGESFQAALGVHPCFPRFAVAMVGLGETTGELDLVLSRAAAAMERRRELARSVVAALSYPAVVVVMTTGTVAYLVLGVLPKLTRFLAGFGRRLPAPTQVLVDVSAFVQTYLVHGMVLGVLLALILFAVWLAPAGRLALHRFALRTPIVGGILRLAATASFARNLGVLMQSGVRLTEALEVVEPMVENRWARREVAAVRARVVAGAGFAEPLAQARSFLPMLGSMAAVGESSGALDDVLREVAHFHDQRLAARIARLGAILEPLIVVVLGVIVGFVYLAFFLAIYAIAPGGS